MMELSVGIRVSVSTYRSSLHMVSSCSTIFGVHVPNSSRAASSDLELGKPGLIIESRTISLQLHIRILCIISSLREGKICLQYEHRWLTMHLFRWVVTGLRYA